MIPKKIHYCWFGNGEKTKLAKKCIASWRKYCPDYEIIEWNEGNFDVNINPYVKMCYEQKKYAFLTDYLRLLVVLEHGGLYFDTDVEIVKNFDDILEHDFFIGFENEDYLATCVIGSKKGNLLIQYFMSFYDNRHFINQDGSLNTHTNTKIITKMLHDCGVALDVQNSDVFTEYNNSRKTVNEPLL